MLAPAMRPAFNAGIYYAPVPEGVYLRGNNNRLLLKGASLYPLLEHLVPLLNGETTLEALTCGLDSRRARMITRLLETLFAHRLLQDVSQEQGAPAECCANLAFLASLQTSAAARLAHFQARRLLLLGDGPACVSLLQASLQGGVRRISVLSTARQECLAGREVGGQGVQFLSPAGREDEDEVRTYLQDCDAVLHFATSPALARARLLNRLCIAQRKTCIQAVVVGEQAWIGPLVCAQTQGCWECAWRRLQSHQAPEEEGQGASSAFRDDATAGGQELGAPELTMIANRLVFALFTSDTGTDYARAGERLSALHLATGLSESHAFLPHPHCQACQHPEVPTAARFLEQIRQRESQPPGERDGLTDAVVDPMLGLFTIREAENSVQAPLALYTTALSDPMRRRPAVLTAALLQRDRQQARWQIARDACAAYAASLVDHRRLFPVEAGGRDLWAWALDLQTQQACPVPAERVFPALSQQAADVRGVAWGMSWEEAVGRALVDRCQELAVARLTQASRAYPEVDLAQVRLSAEGLHLSRLLQILVGSQLAVYDVTGRMCLPTFATCVGEEVVACTTACDELEALEMGLLRALAREQAVRCGQAVSAQAPLPALPRVLRGGQMSVSRAALPDTWAARLAWLVQRLQAEGFCTLAVPLDHDPALARIVPWIVRVLVWRELPQGGA